MPAEAVLAALDAILSALARLNRPCALLGGLALAIWKHPRFTKDVDVLVAIDESSVRPLVQNLIANGFRTKRGDGLVKLGELELLQMVYDPPGALVEVQVDLLLARDDYQHQALARRIHMPLSELNAGVDVLSCEDLILFKLMAGRMIDRADAAALLRANRPTIDFEYLLGWVSAKQLASDFEFAWNEAFPGEAIPAKES